MEIIRALGTLAEAPGPEQIRAAQLLELPGEPTRAEFTDLFVVQLYPHASVYLNSDGQPAAQVGQPSDHLSALLTFYAKLNDDDARRAFLWAQLISWVLPFAMRAQELGSPMYRAWATLLLDTLEGEASQLGNPLVLPTRLSDSHNIATLSVNETLVDGLFAPVTSGVILTRADLSRCVSQLQLPTRVAERRYTLREMMMQEPVKVAGWLAAEARRQAGLWTRASATFDVVRAHWEMRALKTADTITEMTLKVHAQ
ncbi:MAG TPA: hypothetical protein VM100_01800 [Longimicrobiales bacterium]|nr:hypothetical protein [Longimicrobiales bacterium]